MELKTRSGLSNQGDVNMNVTLEYPHNDFYEYATKLERIDFDKQYEEDVKTGRGFLISDPKGLKKDIKTQDGIFSFRFGSNSISDTSSFVQYRCRCGMKHGSIRFGEYCESCKSMVKYVGDDPGITGYIRLKDDYRIIHPTLYASLEAFIGKARLERIICPKITVDSDGKIIKGLSKNLRTAPKKDEIFAGIGIVEFRERFDEIMDYYVKKYPQKQMYYDDIMANKNILFTRSIAVYSSLLRPSKVDDGSLKYEACNEEFMILSTLTYRANKIKPRKGINDKPVASLIYDIQTHLNNIYIEIRKMLAGKKGDIRSAIGGRHIFSARCVIRQDVKLRCNQVRLPYHALCELLQQIIINILTKTYNITYAEAYKKWYRAQISNDIDEVIYNIINGLIKNSPYGGLPVLINRNPTIAYGGVLNCICVGINKDYSMSLSLLVLAKLKADFDGDTLNVLYLYNQEFIEAAKVISPKAMFISRNNGKCDKDLLFSRDIIININSLKHLAEYTDEEVAAIRALQAID